MVLVIEGRLPAQYDEEDHPQAPIVAAEVVRFLFEDLGCDVARRTSSRRSQLFLAEEPRQAEIRDLYSRLLEVL